EAAPPEGAKARVVTFINNLTNDLKLQLGDLAEVSTFHAYCRSVLHRNEDFRGGLTEDFTIRPKLVSLIKDDWIIAGRGDPPAFMDHMRNLELEDEHAEFYFARGDYYNAVDFDDSVYRVYKQLSARPDDVEESKLILVDEYQDFNGLEVALIEALGGRNPIVVAGDDDQALYSQLRNASSEFIRRLHSGGVYERFELPFCMRCTAVIVDAIG